MTPATIIDRLMAIQALVHRDVTIRAEDAEAHAGIIARLLDAEEYDVVSNSMMRLDSDNAVEALKLTCDYFEGIENPSDYGAQQDCDSGVWEDTDRWEKACADAREDAADNFMAIVREELPHDLYEQTPKRLAEILARTLGGD